MATKAKKTVKKPVKTVAKPKKVAVKSRAATKTSTTVVKNAQANPIIQFLALVFAVLSLTFLVMVFNYYGS